MARADILLLALAVLGACAPLRPAHIASTDHEALASRLERAGRRLTPAGRAGERVVFSLSSRSELGAWSWPDGDVRVSRSLVELLDDEELAAALAHELGHLLDGGHLDGLPAALAGASRGAGEEARADLLGCALLARAGTRPAALPAMLRTLSAAIAGGAPGPDPQALLRRADAAERACGVAR